MILIGDFFHISNNTTYILGIKKSNFNFEFPIVLGLYIEGKFIQKIKLEGMVLNNDYKIDEAFDKITVWVNGHLNKELINDKVDAYLQVIRE